MTYYKAFDTLMNHDLRSTQNCTTKEQCVQKAFLEFMMKEHDAITLQEKETLLDNHGIIIIQREERFDH